MTSARPVHVRGAIRGASIVDNIDADYDTDGVSTTPQMNALGGSGGVFFAAGPPPAAKYGEHAPRRLVKIRDTTARGVQ